MPRNGAIVFSDLIGKLDAVQVTCAQCGRNGRYRLQRLIAERGGDASLPDWLHELTATCPKRQATFFLMAFSTI
jgi:hypothetical protein